MQATELAEQLHRPLVALQCPPRVAEALAGVTETVPGGRLSGPVAEFAVQCQGLGACVDRLPVVTEFGVEPADVRRGVCQAGPFPDGLEGRGGLPTMLDG